MDIVFKYKRKEAWVAPCIIKNAAFRDVLQFEFPFLEQSNDRNLHKTPANIEPKLSLHQFGGMWTSMIRSLYATCEIYQITKLMPI